MPPFVGSRRGSFLRVALSLWLLWFTLPALAVDKIAAFGVFGNKSEAEASKIYQARMLNIFGLGQNNYRLKRPALVMALDAEPIDVEFFLDDALALTEQDVDGIIVLVIDLPSQSLNEDGSIMLGRERLLLEPLLKNYSKLLSHDVVLVFVLDEEQTLYFDALCLNANGLYYVTLPSSALINGETVGASSFLSHFLERNWFSPELFKPHKFPTGDRDFGIMMGFCNPGTAIAREGLSIKPLGVKSDHDILDSFLGVASKRNPSSVTRDISDAKSDDEKDISEEIKRKEVPSQSGDAQDTEEPLSSGALAPNREEIAGVLAEPKPDVLSDSAQNMEIQKALAEERAKLEALRETARLRQMEEEKERLAMIALRRKEEAEREAEAKRAREIGAFIDARQDVLSEALKSCGNLRSLPAMPSGKDLKTKQMEKAAKDINSFLARESRRHVCIQSGFNNFRATLEGSEFIDEIKKVAPSVFVDLANQEIELAQARNRLNLYRTQLELEISQSKNKKNATSFSF